MKNLATVGVRLCALASAVALSPGFAAASDGIGNVALVATSANLHPGATVHFALCGPPASPFSLLVGSPGGAALPGVGPVDLQAQGWVIAASGTFPGSGTASFDFAAPPSTVLVGSDFVFQGFAIDAASPTGVGVSNPHRVEIGPATPVAFAVAASALPALPFVNGMRAAAGDVDADGDLDVYMPTFAPGLVSFEAPNLLLLNDGSGGFADSSATHLPAIPEASRRALLVDLDGDFDLDAAVANGIDSLWNQFPTQSRWYANDGTGHFALGGLLPGGPDYASDLAAGDLDGDGDVDLVVARNGNGAGAPDRLLLNDGSGGFTDGTNGPGTGLPAVAGNTSRAMLGDLDGDGVLDLVTVNYDTGGSRVFRNDGEASFTLVAGGFPAAASVWGTDGALGDLDADGDLDVLQVILLGAPPFTRHVRLFANDGAGVFSLVPGGIQGIPEEDDVIDLAVADFDGDGDLDLVVVSVTEGTTDWLLLNDGSGHFSPTAAGIPAGAGTRHALPLDVDGDNVLDLFYGANAANGGAQVLVRP